MTARKPITYHVGCFILEEMHAHDWQVRVLASRADIDQEHLMALILGEDPLTDEDAAGLAKAFGTSELMWKRLGGISQEATL